MSEPPTQDVAPAPPAGLCNTCAHQQLVPTTRGSVFSLCRRSRDEPERYRRYPPIPVTRCPGYEPRGAGGGGDAA